MHSRKLSVPGPRILTARLDAQKPGVHERIEVSLAYLDAFVPGYAYTDPGWELVRHLYRGLVKVGPEFELQPGERTSLPFAQLGIGNFTVIITASEAAVEPSYMEAFATSMPVSSQIIV